MAQDQGKYHPKKKKKLSYRKYIYLKLVHKNVYLLKIEKNISYIITQNILIMYFIPEISTFPLIISLIVNSVYSD